MDNSQFLFINPFFKTEQPMAPGNISGNSVIIPIFIEKYNSIVI
jgi:hypothetical protein